MNENLPPKRVTDVVRSQTRASGRDLQRPGLSGSPTLTADGRVSDSLPVLKAFQDFLDTERRHTQVRIVSLSGVFLVLLLCLAAGAFFIGWVFFDRIQQDFSRVQHGLSALRAEAGRVQSVTEVKLSELSQQARLLADQVADQTNLPAAREALDLGISNYISQVVDVQSAIGQLSEENTMLREELGELRAGWPTLTASVEAMAHEIDRLRTPSNTAAAAAGTAPSLDHSIEIAITPPGATRAVPWRLPIPE
jgi:methyl-accepting chemotaxis protein